MSDDLKFNGDAEYLLWFSMPGEELVSIIRFTCTYTRLPLHRPLPTVEREWTHAGSASGL